MPDVPQSETLNCIKMMELEQVAAQTEKLDIGISLVTESQSLENFKISFRKQWVLLEHVGFGLSYKKTLRETMEVAAHGIAVARVISVDCRSVKCPLPAKDLKRLVLEAWCEGFNVAVPSDGELKKATSSHKAEKEAVKDALLTDLRKGGDGLARWNAWTETKIPPVKNFRRADLHGTDLTGAKFKMLDMQGTNFEGCVLSGVSFYGGDIRSCNFRGADLTGAKISSTVNGADFSKATLKDAQLRGSTLSNANYTDTDFSGADLSYVDMRGSDLSRAMLANVTFEYTKFDERTKFPEGFDSDRGLVFSGDGKDPFLIERIKAVLPPGKVDFDWFIKRLEAEFDEKRMEKALRMLKAESFQLFGEAGAERIVGVVRSQRTADLFYSCYLKNGGAYSCCSQHLLPCGGLRGALCKHLLVLLIGMTKAGQIDPATASEWVLASRTKNPSNDKELMTSTLLRYKGAESGEVDWRPTETMPEDYYAY